MGILLNLRTGRNIGTMGNTATPCTPSDGERLVLRVHVSDYSACIIGIKMMIPETFAKFVAEQAAQNG